MRQSPLFIVATLFVSLLAAGLFAADKPIEISGRYPHLAMFNHNGECGTGAVVPWAGRLWVITYAPHMPEGSDDKLYEIDDDLHRVTRPESVGGTPADRLIHRESNQLIIGPYFIDAQRHVRAVQPKDMVGRLTAAARHLTDPANMVYIYDMEGRLYEVNVHTLKAKLLFEKPIPGWHGKGGYTSQGRLVLANNGESAARHFKTSPYQVGGPAKGPEDHGVLAEWDGKTWKIVERHQFTDVTGPGGIYGAPNDQSPLWAIGWDKRSVELKLLDHGQWYTYRMPKADYTYDAWHGWHTEWPRIRAVIPAANGKPAKLLMNMHGGWFNFPVGFDAAHTGGIRPLGDYLKITGDFTGWNGRIVFGCDDTAKSGFNVSKHGFNGLNNLIAQSNSNLWFTTWDGLKHAGRVAGFGGPWVNDDVKKGVASTPYLFAGYDQRVLHIVQGSDHPVTFRVEFDKDGTGKWTPGVKITVPAHGYAYHIFDDAPGTAGEVDAAWVRLVPDSDAHNVTTYFIYGPGGGHEESPSMFASLADIKSTGAWSGAVMRSEGDDRVTLGVMAQPVGADGQASKPITYQVGADMKFTETAADSASAAFLKAHAAVADPTQITYDDASVIVNDGKVRVRLPRSVDGYDHAWATGWARPFREIVTERSLMNVAGSFYLVPRDDDGGMLRMKPVCTHNKRITDFCSWRGMLVMSGCRADAEPDGHYFAAPGGKVGLWFGDIDDLWKMGLPRGHGGPWMHTAVKADQPSDPYLMFGYNHKTLTLSHEGDGVVHMTIEVDFLGSGYWHAYKSFDVPAGKSVTYKFPDGYTAHWLRIKADKACTATAQLEYN